MTKRPLHCLMLCLLACAALAAGCGSEEPNPGARARQIEDAIHDIVQSIEQRSVGQVLDHLSHDFKSEDGLGFVDVQAIVETFLLRGEVVGVRLENLSLEPADGKRQRVQVWVSFARRRPIRSDGALPPGAVTYAFDLIFEHLDGRWQALSGSYERQ